MIKKTMIAFFVLGYFFSNTFAGGLSVEEIRTKELIESKKISKKKTVIDINKIDEDDLLDELENEFLNKTKNDKINDPLYYLNKTIFYFNDKTYFYILSPISNGYVKITPAPVRKGISNFFTNLASPIRIANNLLQMKIKNATKETASFLLNTIVGWGGIFKPSKDFKSLSTHKEDLGQTFGKYGIGNGFYLVLPFLGPSTLRDTVGSIGDSFLSYSNYLDNNLNSKELLALKFTKTINEAKPMLKQYNDLKKIAIAPYESIRNAYIQKRNQQIKQ